MPHSISSSDSNKIIFQRDATGCTTKVFVVVGSFFFLIGIGLNVFMDTWEMPFLLFRILFPLFGAGAVAAGLHLPKQTKESIPEQITFDHNKGAVIIEMVKGGNEMAHIRYDEIEGFDIYTETRRSSSSSSRTSTTTYVYHVFLKKKDGGEWFLSASSDTAKAEAILNMLKTQVPIDKPSAILPSSKLSIKISKQEGIDKTVIHWQNKVSFLMPIFLVVFSVAFFRIIGTVVSGFGGGFEFFIYGVAGFMAFVFLLVMVPVVRKLIRDVTSRYAVAVSKSQFEYYEFSKSSGKMKNQKALPMATVDRIVYSFGQPMSNMNSTLRVLTKEDVAHWQKTKESPMTLLTEMFTGKNQPITLSIAALNPVECLQLESWLQELILRKSDRTVM